MNVLVAALRNFGYHVAHGEENYSVADATLNTLERNRQVFRYRDAEGRITRQSNPNCLGNIANI